MNNEQEQNYVRHLYDIELKSLLKRYEEGIKQVQLPENQGATYFINLIKFSINEYCKFKKLSFEDEIQIVITPNEEGPYQNFLTLSLIFFEIYKIKLCLNYQEKLFNINDKDYLFIDLVEFIIVDSIKYASPFDNTQRLTEIMEWVWLKRNNFKKKKNCQQLLNSSYLLNLMMN
jgi:hypothetical protein